MKELQLGYLARRVYEKLSDAQIDPVFEVALSNGVVQDLLASSDSAFDWHGAAILRAMKHRTFRNAILELGRSISGG